MSATDKASPISQNEDLIGTTEAAKILGINTSTLRRWLAEGRVRGSKVGKKWRFRRGDLRPLLDGDEPGQDPETLSQELAKATQSIGHSPAQKKRLKKEMASLLSQMESPPTDTRLPAWRLVFCLLANAVDRMATDLHLMPWADSGLVQQRYDGVLYDVAELPKAVHRAATEVCKGLCRLDKNETRLPQCGALSARLLGREVNFWIDTMPTVHGESVTIRVIDSESIMPPLDRLGLEKGQKKLLDDLIHRPCGIIFLAGPTPSGRTATMYAILRELAGKDRKIVTIEDPVEADIPGVLQTQVNPDVGLSYTRAVRSFMRHAPNIVGVGDVRDQETAEILAKIALTGHLAVGIGHWTDAFSGIERLAKMGVSMAKLSSAIQAIIGLRLVRRICPDCKVAYRPKAKDLYPLGLRSTKRHLYRGKGCERCYHIGYLGRTGVFEILDFTDAVREAVYKGAPRDELARIARRGGFRPLREMALKKLTRGETTVEEVTRELA